MYIYIHVYTAAIYIRYSTVNYSRTFRFLEICTKAFQHTLVWPFLCSGKAFAALRTFAP